jgi:hypothetical protein
MVNANPIAIIDVSGPTTFCAGNSITLTASPGYSYLWSNGLRTKSITVEVSGVFSVKVTNEAGCTTTSEPITITINPLPTAKITTLGAPEFCAGGSVILKATPGSFGYLWSNGAKDSTITVTKSGVYTVTVFNATGCFQKSEAVTVTVHDPTPITAIADRQICINFGLTALVASPAGGKFTGSGMTQSVFNPATAGIGKHTILYTYINELSCTSTTSFIIEVSPLTVILPGADTTICVKSGQFILAGPIPPGTIISVCFRNRKVHHHLHLYK